MSESYPFRFEKAPKKKGTCPQCSQQNKFRYYEDLTGNRLEDFGRCERTNGCGYHVVPSGKVITKTEGNYIPAPELVQIYPDTSTLAKFNKFVQDHSSNFHTYCLSLGISHEHLTRWHVGTDGAMGRTVFVFLNAQGAIVNAKWFSYLPTGKRDKTVDSFSLKQPKRPDNSPTDMPEKRYSMSLFGEHLLDPAKKRTVMIVESEKTAVIASWFYQYHQYDWIAVGSANGLTDVKIGALYGRRLVWLSDADGNQLITDKKGKQTLSKGGRNNSSINKLLTYQQNFCVIDLFPMRNDGSDIADAIGQKMMPDLNQMLEEAHELDNTKQPGTVTIVIGKEDFQVTDVHTADSEIPAKIEVSLAIDSSQLANNISVADDQAIQTGKSKAKTGKGVKGEGKPKADKPPIKPKPRTDKPKDEDDEYEVFIDPSVWYHKKGHNILIKGQRGWNVVAKGFFIEIRFMTEDENENQMWILEIKPDKNRESIFLEVPHDDFCSASRLKRLVTSKQFSLQISDTELAKLHEYLFTETEFKKAIKIIRFGLHPESGVFFFANAAVKDGKKLIADEFNIIQSEPFYLCMPTVPKKGRHPFTLTESNLKFNDWYTIYQQAHLYQIAFIPVCFYLMSLFRDIAIDYKNFSPILYLKGSAGTGKSSIVRNLTCLYGFKAKDINLKSKNTAAALVKLMSQSSNTIVWMDEFFNKFEHEGLLQAAYDNAGYHLSAGVGTTETAEIDIKSALALTSNYTPENPIFFSRCLFIPINNNTKTPEQGASYKKLLMLEEEGLGAITVEMLNHRQVVLERYSSAYTSIYNGLTKQLNAETPERLKQNMAQVMTSAFILNSNGLISMTEYSETEDILDEFVRIGVIAIKSQDILQSDKTPLSEFFQILQQLFDEKRLIEGIHFRFEGPNLHFRFSQLYTTFMQKYRQVFFKDPPDKDSIVSELEQLVGITPGAKFLRNIRFRPDEHENQDHASTSVNNSCSVPYLLMCDRFGIDFTT